ncbi:MAG: hypothetical protein ACYTG7_22050 [Planctomycetota bacterium]|jgi:hypothetical protein
MKHANSIPILAMIFTAIFIITAFQGFAYEMWHHPSTPGQGYCTDCHHGFSGGQSSTLHILHTAGSDPITLNCNLCHRSPTDFDNPIIVWSYGDGPGSDGLGCTGCHGRDYEETIQHNHGGKPIAGLPKSSGYGLIKRHTIVGVFDCYNCHANVPQSFIKPEYVNPPNYSRTDVSIGGRALYAADHEDTGNDPDSYGLDNDGDLAYDADDPDCSLTADGHLVSESAGGTVNFTLDAGADRAWRNYIILGSFSGTEPGFSLPGGLETLPINWDWFTDVEMGLLNSAFFSNFLSSLDGSGLSSAQLFIPPLPAGTAGFTMHYAFCLNSPFNFVSNPSEVKIGP